MTERISDVFAKLGLVLCIDLETAMAPLSFQGREHVRLLQVLSDNGEHWWDLQTFTDDDWRELALCLESPALTIVGQNVSYDLRCLLGCGIRLRGQLEDTMIQSALLNNGLPNVSNGLAAIAKRHGINIDKALQAGGGEESWMVGEITPERLDYAMTDVRVTWHCWQEQRAQIKSAGLQRVYDLERSLIPAVVEMEHTGMLVDRQVAEAAIATLDEQITSNLSTFLETLDERLRETRPEEDWLPREEDGRFNLRAKSSGSVRLGTRQLAGFNVNSSQQLIQRLNAIGITPKDAKTGKPSTDRRVLRPYADDPVVFSLLAYKKAAKRLTMIQTLLDEHIAEDGRIHARFSPLATGTGRFACSKPNLQQIPREPYIRDIFVAVPGYELVVMDVSAMELRVACSEPIANEVVLQQAFAEGVDPHIRTAALMFDVQEEDVTKEQRRQSKSVNFGALYGSAAGGVKEYFNGLGLEISLDEAADFLRRWKTAYPGFARWHERCRQDVERQGEVRMVDGRRRILLADMARPTVAANNIVQGTSASIVKLTMVEVHRRLPEGARLIATVHDELIVEAPTGQGEEILQVMKEQLREAGRAIIGDSVEMLGEGSVAASWGQAK